MKELTDRLKEYILNGMAKDMEETTPPEYEAMKYPRLIPVMKFGSHLFKAEGYGHIFMMDTSGMGGALKLLTLSFTPGKGGDLPYLLIDVMTAKNKALAYAEYYDCTGKKLKFEKLEEIKERYGALPDYAEKDAWYVKERMPVSLIKGGEGADREMLFKMVKESAEAYLEISEKAACDPANREGLAAFRERMLSEGNPSGATMEKLLGKEGYAEFYKKCVMPL